MLIWLLRCFVLVWWMVVSHPLTLDRARLRALRRLGESSARHLAMSREHVMCLHALSSFQRTGFAWPLPTRALARARPDLASPPSGRFRPFQGNLPRLPAASFRVKRFFVPLPEPVALVTRGGGSTSGVRRHVLGFGAPQANLPILRLGFLLVNPSRPRPLSVCRYPAFRGQKNCSGLPWSNVR